LAAVNSQHVDLTFQQLAVSHAAHDALIWIFHGTLLYISIDKALITVLGPIGINSTTPEWDDATQIGRNATAQVVTIRLSDGMNNFVQYTYGPAIPGVYQQTPGGGQLPDTPQA